MKDKFDDDKFLNDNFFGDEITTSRSPNHHESDTLRERLNPEKEIEAFKMALMGAYKVNKKVTDEEGDDQEVTTMKRMKNFTPILNKQGIEEVTDYLKNLINSHTFQSNFLDKQDYNNTCKFTFNMMAANFISKRREWALEGKEKVDLINIRFVYEKAKNIAKIGLRRALNDAERGHLSDTVKETISTNNSAEKKENLLQKAAGMLR